MKDNDYRLAGYIFSDEYDYKEAKKEEESIEYIKANTNLSDLNKVIKLYNKLIERKTFKTVIGIMFLKELQGRILKEEIADEENLPCIQVEKSGQSKSYSSAITHETEQRHKDLINNFRIKLRNSRIINTFLVFIIIAMILITIFAGKNSYSDIENDILDKYSAWEEKLDARQKILDEKEAALNQD
jgi:hypothetical protein